MAMVFRACAGSDRDVEIDVTKGIRRAITTKVPAPVSTPTPATVMDITGPCTEGHTDSVLVVGDTDLNCFLPTRRF